MNPSTETLAGNHGNHRLRTGLLVLFSFSGFAGLIYESIWSHYLKLLLGHAALAQTLVLSIFMGGMAVGAWLASRRAEGRPNPLRTYAVIEAIVGLAALAFHFVFVRVLDLVYADLVTAFSSTAAIEAIKWTAAACLIVPQSVLLGATFPLMSSAVIRLDPSRRGSSLAMLYFTNSLGAAIGVLAGAFVLIPSWGLPGVMTFAGAVNLLLAAVAFRLSADPAPRPADGPTQAAEPARAAWIVTAALLTGAASFFYEIGWIRMLTLVLGATTQAFELMLSAFITGLALGGLWIRKRIDSIQSPLRVAGHVQVLMGLAALATIPLYAGTFDVMAFLLKNLERTDEGYALFNLGSHAIALAIMLPATILAGMTLPLFTFALTRSGGERAIGRVYAANTVGAIIGVLAAVHLAMPVLGTKGVVALGAAADVALGLVLLAVALPAGKRRELRWATVAAVALLAIVVGGVRLDPLRTASGVYRHGNSSLPQGSEVLFHRDGKTATIDLIRHPGGMTMIATNGKPDAQIATDGGEAVADEATMVLLGALPLAFHPEARSVANIGMGSGMTTHTLLGSRRLERVDTVEIEPAMVEAARGFGPRVARAWDDPRSRIHLRDAKTFFAGAGRRYDVIVSEPSNPWVSGVASLFSTEFYAHAKAHLAADGLLVQWLQLYETNTDLLASVFRSLSVHFDDWVVFHADNANVVVLATNGRSLGSVDPRVFAEPALRRDLERVGILGPSDMEVRRLGSRELLEPLFATSSAPLNSDYRPYLGYAAPRSRFLQENAADLTRLHVAPVPVLELLEPDARQIRGRATESPHFTPSRLRGVAHDRVAALAELDVLSAAGGTRDTDDPLVRLHDALCAGTGGGDQAIVSGLLQLAATTTPYVEGREIEGMWARLRACSERRGGRARDWVRLHQAVAARDARAMVSESERLLAADDFASPAELEFVVTSGLSGAIANGDGSTAERFASRLSGLSYGDGGPPVHLRLLLAHLR